MNAPDPGRVRVGVATIAGGLTIPYGEAGDPGGLPVMFVHAYVESWRYFRAVLERLPTWIHGYAPTGRGHGDADRPAAGYRVEDFAGDTVAFLDALGIDRAVLVGTSSGGVICQAAAGTHPERIMGLVLISTPASLADKPSAARMWQTVSRLDDPLSHDFVTGFVRDTCPESLPDRLIDALVKESLKVPAHVWKQTMRGLLDADPAVIRDRITAPTLLIWGDRDRFVARSDQETILRALHRARLVVYPGAGHGVHLAQPGRVVEDIAGFLDTVVTH